MTTREALEDVDDVITKRQITLPLGIVVEKRKSEHPWGDWIWTPVEVIPGANKVSEWIKLQEGENWTQFHIATLPLTLHRKETEAFKMNLENEVPHLYVVLRGDDEDHERPVKAHMVTASPFDAQDYLDTSEDIIEKVPMPAAVLEWVRAFVSKHHVEETFKKRKRDKINVEEHKFGKHPIFTSATRH